VTNTEKPLHKSLGRHIRTRIVSGGVLAPVQYRGSFGGKVPEPGA
jgi:hypothetical protein